ncbi:MAG: four helix bundle protein [Ignavibacteriales bacterium]|nr:four helix bundle protein [Ignavibacteriales bacterium]
MKKNLLKEKSFLFAVRCIRLNKHFRENLHEYVLSKQLMRSGTSIGANVREALNAESTADFIHKLSIAQKECDETQYWIELMKETNYLSEIEFASVYSDCTELLKIIRSIILTTKKRDNTKMQRSPLHNL